jgi:SWI/SNF-related matrix-associated actin-dependent regulator of chromatin subfamily A3
VFLLSMRSGAVGINLTAANHVFILEPAMNPALEDRAFRMGQQRPVVVKKLYIKVLLPAGCSLARCIKRPWT